MKFVAVIAVILFVGLVYAEDAVKLNDEQKLKVRNIAGDCIKESQATEEKVQALRKGDFSNVDDATKCFAKCFLNKLGFYANGAVQSDELKKTLGPLIGEEQLKTINAKCHDIKGKDDCDTAYEIYKCYHTEKTAL